MTGRVVSKVTREKLAKIRKTGIFVKGATYEKVYGKERAEQIIQEKMTKIMKSLHKQPNGWEQKIIDLCEEFNLPFKYVGNGKFWIGTKNPDFVSTNDKKLLIEIYYSYYKDKNYEQKRQNYFAKYGFKTLFLDENCLDTRHWQNICLTKIQNFLELV